MTDYYDIYNWLEKPEKYFTYLKNLGSDQTTLQNARPLNVDASRLYALLHSKVSKKPNGFYTQMQDGKPLDNLIWWDFVLECDRGFIHIWRTVHVVEATFYLEGEIFDLDKFLHINMARFNVEIQRTLESFDRHTVYTNHYKSYKDCVEFLWSEISTLDLNPPTSPDTHAIEKIEIQRYLDGVEKYKENSIKFHSLGKSLLLNAAFEIESFLNLVIRIGATPQLKDYPDVLKKHLNNSFVDKLKNIKFYSMIFHSNVDIENQFVKDALALMTIRNKYVHFDETSAHNKIGEIYYDGDFPLQPTTKDAPAVDTFKQIFHRPDFSAVKKAYDTAQSFINYIESLFFPNLRDQIDPLLVQNPIGYNENRKMYSGISNEYFVEFYLSMEQKLKS